MAPVLSQANLTEVLSSLSEIPLIYRDGQDAALKKITELGRQAMSAPVCTLIFVDREENCLVQKACAGLDDKSESELLGKKFKIGSLAEGHFIDRDLVEKAELVEKYNLQSEGQGVANPEIAHKYNLNSVLSYPLKSEGELTGYFNYFSSSLLPFSPDEKKLLEIFARQAEITIESFKHNETFDRWLTILNDLWQDLLSVSPGVFLQRVADKACELLRVPICIVWTLDRQTGRLKIAATTGEVNEEFKIVELNYHEDDVMDYLSRKQPTFYLSDVAGENRNYKHRTEAMAQGWGSLLSAPMRVDNRLIGMVDVYTKSLRRFKKWERDLFGAFAKQAAMQNDALRERQKQEDRDRLVAKIRAAVDRVTKEAQDQPIDESLLNELGETLNLIVRECAMATPAKTSHIRLWNKATDALELKAFYPPPPDLEPHSLPLGKGIAGYVAEKGESYNCKDTDKDDHFTGFYIGIKPLSILCVPIKSGETIIGTLSLGSDVTEAFGADEEQLLENIVGSVSIAIERANVVDSLLRLAKASTESKSLESLLDQLVELTRDLMREPICLVWMLDKDRNGFSVKAFAGPETHKASFDHLIIKNDAEGIDKFLKRVAPLCFKDVTKVRTHFFYQTVERLGWKSMLAIPLKVKESVIGILEVYTQGKERDFTDWHRKLFKALAFQAAVAIENLTGRQRLERLNTLIQQVADLSDKTEILDKILQCGLDLVGSTRGWISLLNLESGELKIEAKSGNPLERDPLMFGEGISGRALQTEKIINIADVPKLSEELKEVYQVFWKDTRSELAVPIMIGKAKVRKESDPHEGSKPIGVLNIESPTVDAFSQADADIIWSLACHAALIVERLELDRTLTELAKIQGEIVGKRNFDETIQILMDGITNTLGYQYVNISMVTPDRKRIKTEYVKGIPEKDVKEFKRMADHTLESDDIQAVVVKERQIIVPTFVPERIDRRFDEGIYKKFEHHKKIRVFVPMIVSSNNRVLGTVEAGFERKYRNYIYEHDVQILKRFVDYAVLALEQRNRGILEKISHEFFTPIEGIRSNASFLQRRLPDLLGDRDFINRKFDDMMTDCMILLQQVGELEHLLGRSSNIPKIQKTLVFRDIIIKTVKQLKPKIAEQGFDISRVEYKESDIPRIHVFVDRAKLNQVVYNLLINSIKYAENESAAFTIRISVEESKDEFVIVFKDWGMGIEKEYKEKIFEDGFRTPKAINKYVSGSGLGLTISRKAMREMGGDLRLVNNFKPTEFHMVIPKSLRKNPYDSAR